MGDPPKLRNKYETPKRLWDFDRLNEEKELKKSYGLKSMREIWLALAILKKYRREARRLLSLTEEERKQDSEKILLRLHRMGVMKKDASPDDILSLTVKDILERRLQTIVLRKGLAYTMKQSRQLITHGFIQINGRKISVPGYIVFQEEEGQVEYTKPIELKKPPRMEEESKEASTEKPATPPKESKEKNN